MTINRPEAIAYLKNFDFKGLFRESLGWSRANDTRILAYNGQNFIFEAFAQQAGVTAYACQVSDLTQLDYQTRNAIERAAGPNFPSHLFVFFDEEWQVWQWSRRELNQPRQLRSVGPFNKLSSFEPIIQKLEALAYDIAQENVQAVQVERDLRDAFDVEPVTRRFYTQFEAQYKEFLAAIEGIAAPHQREFASLLLNRLMFLYFMQRKGFLLGQTDYLYERFLNPTKRMPKHDDFFGGFLVPLFFEVLSVEPAFRGGKDNAKTHQYDDVFGQLLYLNGGLFSQRDWERNGKIKVPDEALKKIFDFFGAWNWYLDERPTREGNEINPDVLGYVFEKFINQKQMGAYYTKEDITGYIARNTILPFLLEKSGLDLTRPLQLLCNNIERYIYPAIAHGCDLDLPTNIAVGLDDVSQRAGWNKTAPENYGLPTEIWREVVARRARYEALTNNVSQFKSVADLITHNLDIAQWMSDLIADINDAKELEALWSALEEVTILDPTVGSGAFLFAAMGVLGPVYQACLERMDAFVGEAEARAAGQSFKAAPSHEFMNAVLGEIEGHPNRAYAIFKKQAVGNLYGVDIMPEAGEICKLRLFLKLAAQVSPDPSQRNYGIEPLPDIDFNIRAGNTLVGFATLAEAKSAYETSTVRSKDWEEIEDAMSDYGWGLNEFRQIQYEGGQISQEQKSELERKRKIAVESLDIFSAGLYLGDADPRSARYTEWEASHQPFHWCAEFYFTLKPVKEGGRGGFDVIIGNPPYVEYPSKKVDYEVRGYKTVTCGDLYAFVMERCLSLKNSTSSFGVIVPVSIASADGFDALRDCLTEPKRMEQIWELNFAERPAKLFVGVEKRLTVWISLPVASPTTVHVGNYRRWNTDEREMLFSQSQFVKMKASNQLVRKALTKISRSIESEILDKLAKQKPLGSYFTRQSPHSFYYTRKLRYFIQFFDFVPQITNVKGEVLEPSELKKLCFSEADYRNAALPILNSNLFFWFFNVFSDVRNVNKREIEFFPCSLENMSADNQKRLVELSNELMNDFKINAVELTANYGKYGVLTIQSFRPRLSKLVIDEIDRILAVHYGFNEEETDFIINYDIKYRLGREASDEE